MWNEWWYFKINFDIIWLFMSLYILVRFLDMVLEYRFS